MQIVCLSWFIASWWVALRLLLTSRWVALRLLLRSHRPKSRRRVGPERVACTGHALLCSYQRAARKGGVCGLPVAGQATLPTNLQPFECRLSRRCREPFENPTKNQWVNLLVAILAVSPARDTLAIGDFQLMPRTLKYSDGRIAVFCA